MAIQLQPTAAMPLVTDAMNDIFQALQDESMVDLILLRPRLAQMLKDAGNVVTASHTTSMLLDDTRTEVLQLILMLPRQLMMSVAKQTLAYDLTRRRGQLMPETYSGKMKGAYAAAMRIIGRDGRFLSPNELSRVSSGVRKYVAHASEYYSMDKNWSWPGGREAAGFVHRIDRWPHNLRIDRPPRWVKGHSLTVTSKVLALADMLDKYVEASKVFGKPDECLMQSPLMVGCSTQAMEKRCKDHWSADLSRTSSAWALVRCLIEDLGLKVDVVSVPVLATVERWQLPYAERLVTTLAQSFVTQHGFNLIEGGANKDQSRDAMVEKMGKLVFGAMPFTRENCEAAHKSLLARAETKYYGIQAGKLARRLDLLENKLARLPGKKGRAISAALKFQKAEEIYENHHALWNSVLDAQRREIAFAEEEVSAFEALNEAFATVLEEGDYDIDVE